MLRRSLSRWWSLPGNEVGTWIGAGAGALTYDVESRGTVAHRPQLIPYATFAKATKDSAAKALVPREPATIATHAVGAQHAPAPWTPQGSLIMQ